jgi:hypothetical protein
MENSLITVPDMEGNLINRVIYVNLEGNLITCNLITLRDMEGNRATLRDTKDNPPLHVP